MFIRPVTQAVVLLLATLCLLGEVFASTPEAWTDYEKEVTAACVGASGLSDARPAGRLIDFDDRVGISAIVIKGRYPQKHMKKLRGQVLCVFDKKTRTPFVSEAKEIIR